MKIKIAPSILSANFGALLSEIKKVEEAGAEFIHLDIMDGHFVPNITIGPVVIEALKGKTNLILDAHLMIENPEKYIKAFADAGSQIICVHAEVCPDLGKMISLIAQQGARPAVALNPDTPIDRILPVLDQLSLVLIMSVFPGFGGQRFMPEVLPKIRALRKEIDRRKLSVDLEVDGGINLDTAPLAVEAGANVLVAGHAIYHAPDHQKVIRELKALGDH